MTLAVTLAWKGERRIAALSMARLSMAGFYISRLRLCMIEGGGAYTWPGTNSDQ